MDLIIAAVTQRTGSTLLQRICNTRKKTLIWGEPGGLIKDYSQLYQNLIAFSQRHNQERLIYFRKKEDPNNWIGCMNPDTDYVEKMIVSSVKSGLETYYSQFKNNHDIIGFKEVLCDEEQLSLLRKCYPDMPILLLVRNPLNVWKSLPSQWYKSVNDFANDWNKIGSYYYNLSNNDEKAFIIRYEDIIQREKKTIKLLTLLTKVSNKEIELVLSCKIDAVVGKRNEIITDSEEKIIKEVCSITMNRFNY